MVAEKEFYETCFRIVKKVAPAVRPLATPDIETPLRVLGLDSLDVMNFLLELELETGLRLESVDPKIHTSLGKIHSLAAAENSYANDAAHS